MNRENIQKVRDHIAGLERSRFNMANPYPPHKCGSAGCIGGWANVLCGVPNEGNLAYAAPLLGLDNQQASELFYMEAYFDDPAHEDMEMSDVSPAQAVRVLDHLLETGEVDWSIIDAPSPSSDRGGS